LDFLLFFLLLSLPSTSRPLLEEENSSIFCFLLPGVSLLLFFLLQLIPLQFFLLLLLLLQLIHFNSVGERGRK
jgi:hypothetical protein